MVSYVCVIGTNSFYLFCHSVFHSEGQGEEKRSCCNSFKDTSLCPDTTTNTKCDNYCRNQIGCAGGICKTEGHVVCHCRC